ncbi:hypothetical protein P171DRAFT_515541 [Karstenula rhodostoma CBS 690.94]|uniref:Uncharacterized protein n=1 Tax=Karstenula rhodostoma CBS 690.94 TaxID=1392251 RepID=A0A9P4UGW3_9PLEO|nr:hypothetical protein P171DRAFT_515541 [Karstenula rhodostoma CBS 690.94]
MQGKSKFAMVQKKLFLWQQHNTNDPPRNITSNAINISSNQSASNEIIARVLSYFEKSAHTDMEHLPTPPPTPTSSSSLSRSAESSLTSEDASAFIPRASAGLKSIRLRTWASDFTFGKRVLDNKIMTSRWSPQYSVYSTPTASSASSHRKSVLGDSAPHHPLKPKPRYPGPSHLSGGEEHGIRNKNSLTRICSACGLQLWQCANAPNVSGVEWNKVPRINVHVEQHERARLLQYYKQQTQAQRDEDEEPSPHRENKGRHMRKVRLYIVPRKGCQDTPVEVRVGLKQRDQRTKDPSASFDGMEQVEVLICEGKSVEIAYHMWPQVNCTQLGGTVSACLIDKTGQFRVDALLIKSLH